MQSTSAGNTFHLRLGHSEGPWVSPGHLRVQVVHPLQAPWSSIWVPAERLRRAAFHSGYLLPYKTSLLALPPAMFLARNSVQVGEEVRCNISALFMSSSGLAVDISIGMGYDLLLLTAPKLLESTCLTSTVCPYAHDGAQK